MTFTQPGIMNSPGEHSALFEPLGSSPDELRPVGHGLLIHEHLAHAYGVTLSDEDRASVHERRLEELLGRIVAADPRPLSEVREPAARLAGNCRHFTVLLVALLRSKGIPARGRCGFGAYFGTGMNEDHWVAEYWDAARQRWVLADGQIDDVQLKLFPIGFDLADVPRDQFIVAGDAWALCRAGRADPATFGLSFMGEGGYWWIAGNMMRDALALVNVEMLPWDVWGAMPEPADEVDVAFFDHLAVLTRAPDDHLAELERLAREDDRLRVPGKVRNAVRGVDEPI